MVTMSMVRKWLKGVCGLLVCGMLQQTVQADEAPGPPTVNGLQAELQQRDAMILQLQMELQRLKQQHYEGELPAAPPEIPSTAPPEEMGEHGHFSAPSLPDFSTPQYVEQPAYESASQYSEEPIYSVAPAYGFDNCEPKHESLLDNLSLFAGLEGSKQPQDFGVNATLGYRVAANLGLPISRDSGLGLQIGFGYNDTENAVRVFEPTIDNRGRTQLFTTIGLFQQLDSGLKWAIGYDFLAEDYYDDFFLGQWRGRVGYELSETDEIGVLVNLADRGDNGNAGPVAVDLDPIDQYKIYWAHMFQSQAQITAWAGVADGHSEANFALGDQPEQGTVFVYGADVHFPLNNYLAVFGQTNLITPADTGTVDAFLGFEFYPGGGAYGARKRQFSPLLPVANNTIFSADLRRR